MYAHRPRIGRACSAETGPKGVDPVARQFVENHGPACGGENQSFSRALHLGTSAVAPVHVGGNPSQTIDRLLGTEQGGLILGMTVNAASRRSDIPGESCMAGRRAADVLVVDEVVKETLGLLHRAGDADLLVVLHQI